MARRKSPRVLAAVLVATSAAAISYKIYTFLKGNSENSDSNPKNSSALGLKSGRYANKTIAVTLSHSVLSSGLPLNEILLSSENVTFILPPYLSVDDLASEIESNEDTTRYDVPQTLLQNYKLLKCSNIDGYFHLLKNLRPDMLFVCTSDLGIHDTPPDLRRFVREIVSIDSEKEDVYKVLSEVFLG